MALILDGNGLIQGLSAGGLPDGSVNAGSLASTLDLSSKTMTFGNVTASGITFPASQSASGNPNTLDDYEEGTFTPSIIGSSTSGTASYAVRVARYTKIGNRVFFNLYVEWSSGTGTGNLQLNGLPFTANSTTNNLPVATTHLGNVTLSANNIGWSYVVNGTGEFVISQMPTGGGAASSVPYDAAGAMLLAGHYEV